MRDLNKLVKEYVVPVPIVLQADQTLEEAIRSLRKQRVDEKIIYFYVVDAKERLKGVVSARTLLLKDPDMKVAEVMDKTVIRISADQTLYDAMEYLTAHRLLAVPAIDDENKLLGVINVDTYVDEATKVSHAAASHEIFQILGVTLEEGKRKSTWHTYRMRMPWILCNVAGGTACAVISRMFEVVLLKVIILAMFIPLVLTLSESISMQSMTQSLQLIRKQKLSWHRVIHRALGEWKIILLLSLSCGLMVGGISMFWGGGWMPSVTIAVGLAASIAISASVGTGIPLFLHAKEFDPKLASGPVVLMFSDVITTLIYLGLSTLWLL
jgi:magnesium transporter